MEILESGLQQHGLDRNDQNHHEVRQGSHPEVRQDVRQGTIFINDVTKVDCALFDPSLGIIGQSWHLDLKVTGQLDQNGFVYDFSHLKKLVRTTLKSTLDHALVIPIKSQAITYKDGQDQECWNLESRPIRSDKKRIWSYRCPSGAVFPCRAKALTGSDIEGEILKSLRHRLPGGISDVKVLLREESVDTTVAMFRYTHGIVGHDGLCQRIFHGHRSRIEVYIAEERRPDFEHYIVRDVWNRYIHIATPEQFKDACPFQPGQMGRGVDSHTLRYEGSLGYYEAEIPGERLFIVEQETSIECITRQLALLIKQEEKTKEAVRVVCYEGIDKGGMAVI